MDIENIVKTALSKVDDEINASEIKLSDEFYADYAIDSRKFIYLIQNIEQSLGKMIDDEMLLDAEIITVGDMVDFLRELTVKAS